MDKFTVRRKILRGSLSAPVILTVASPASLAAASTTCLVNTDQTNPPTLFQPAATDDGYLRKTIQVCQLKSPGGGDGAWTSDYYYQSKSGTWHSMTDGSAYASTVTDTRNCASKEVLVFVDAQGQETGYGWPTTAGNGSFTSIGCWHSLLIKP